MRQRVAFVTLLSVVCAFPAVGASAQPPRTAPATAALNPSAKPNPNTKVVPLPGFTLEIPKKNWDPLSVGIGSSLIVFPERSKEAAVAVEVGKLAVRLADSEIVDQTATLEIEDWQARRPLATGFTHKIEATPGGKVIVIDYMQPGARGPERVRLYALPRGLQWYRVICTAPQASFAKYEETFKAIAMSLTPTASQ